MSLNVNVYKEPLLIDILSMVICIEYTVSGQKRSACIKQCSQISEQTRDFKNINSFSHFRYIKTSDTISANSRYF